jgi:hypothetical protein
MFRRAVFAIGPAIGVFLFLTAGAVGAVGRLEVSDPTPTRGAAITVTSTGWSPGKPVTIGLSGTREAPARVAADEDGIIRTRMTVPADVVLDLNVLTATGRAASGVPQEIVTAVAVHGRDASDQTRPWGVIIALGGIAAGLLLLSVISPKPAPRLVAS